jgi:hypothetical protein
MAQKLVPVIVAMVAVLVGSGDLGIVMNSSLASGCKSIKEIKQPRQVAFSYMGFVSGRL